MAAVQFLLNGRPVSTPELPLQTTLLDYLRGEGLTGAKEGCAEGECGACTVLLVTPHESGSAYRAVNSCLMFLPMAAGHEIHTVEDLARDGKLCEAQQAMAAAGGSQCGYCTPGFVMSLFAEQYRPDRIGSCDPHQMGGNLCRCTGYRPIRDAALSLGPAPADAFQARLSQPSPLLGPVQSAGFSRPESVEECVQILAEDPAAKLVAGGTDVGVESNLRASRWAHLVSLEAIAELREFSENDDRVLIGAGLPLTDILRRWWNAPAAVAEWLLTFASPTVRNRATLGGNLGNASPIGDSAPLLLALDAMVHVAGPAGRRTILLHEFFTGYRKTALKRAELITAIEIPKPIPALWRFFKVSKRRMDDISTVAASMALSFDEQCRITRARFAFGGVADRSLRVLSAEEIVVGRPWTKPTVEAAQSAIAGELKPMSDHRGSAAYRLAVAQSLVEKFWHEG